MDNSAKVPIWESRSENPPAWRNVITHINTFQTQSGFQQCKDFIKVTMVFVSLKKCWEFFHVDDVQTTNLRLEISSAGTPSQHKEHTRWNSDFSIQVLASKLWYLSRQRVVPVIGQTHCVLPTFLALLTAAWFLPK